MKINKTKQWIYQHKKLYSILWIIIFSIVLHFSLYSHYTLQPDKFNHILMPFFGICIPVSIIELFISIKKSLNGKEHFPIITLIIGIISFLLGLIKTTAIFLLNYGDIPLTTTQAFIIEYDKGAVKSPSHYKLRFSNHSSISNKELRVTVQIKSQAGDCLSMQYRENAVVIEVRPIKNLGKMSEKECLAQ